MVKKMNTDEYIAWQSLYTTRLDYLRNLVIHTIFDAEQGLLTDEEAATTIEGVNREVKGIIECGKLIKRLSGDG